MTMRASRLRTYDPANDGSKDTLSHAICLSFDKTAPIVVGETFCWALMPWHIFGFVE